ncbi:hypothetical protein J2732_002015 [Achromobacter deleyi]|nr:hypothetical protein [Achromobacter deleyi]
MATIHTNPAMKLVAVSASGITHLIEQHYTFHPCKHERPDGTVVLAIECRLGEPGRLN